MGPKESGAAQVVAYIQRKGAKPTAEKVAEAAETIKALADELAVIWAEAAAAMRNMVAAMVRAREVRQADPGLVSGGGPVSVAADSQQNQTLHTDGAFCGQPAAHAERRRNRRTPCHTYTGP